MISVTHLLGIGHLSRAAVIGRGLAAQGHAVTLVSGGLPAPLITTAGLRFVQLPPVRTRPGDFRSLLDEAGRPASIEQMSQRRAILAEEVARARPDVLVTELFPFGRRALAAEFLETVAAAKAARPDVAVVCSIRDILVVPGKPERVAQTHARLGDLYDAILVHGDPDLIPLEASWPLDPALREKVHYTGYVDAAAQPSLPQSPEPGLGIVVSGGGSAAGLPLFEAALDAAAIVCATPWRLLVGAGVDEDAFQRLRSRAAAHVAVERARADFRQLLGRAALSVSQAGYNTIIDILSAGVPAVLVPFEAGQETEQRLRADLLAAKGRAVLLAESDLSGPRLAEVVRAALAKGRPAPAAPLDGAERTAQIIAAIAQQRRPAKPWLAPARSDGWAKLAQALDSAAEAGCTIRLWWRDDDAVAATPALDRLIDLSCRCQWPLALAAIPMRAERSLAERVADEPLVRVLVHGWSHANHAAAGEKKVEFGSGRSPGDGARDAARGLSRLQEVFGPKLTAVFVPPWNRIAPDRASALRGIGYAALSTYRSQRREAEGGLPVIDTHLDPIDWHGSRGLADPDRLLSELAALIAARTMGEDASEPIGLLTHHLVSGEPVWAFCERLLAALSEHPATRLEPVDGMVASAHKRHRSLMMRSKDHGLEMMAEEPT